MSKYPRLVIDLNKLKNNVLYVKEICKKSNVDVTCVIKGCNGFLEVAKVFEKCEIINIASSRIEQLRYLKDQGINSSFMMIRVPMLSEVDEIVEICDISLNSEIEVLKELNKSAFKQNKIHEVILMKDLGDLREGFFEIDDIVNAALLVENELDNLYLKGIGTNLGCYGAIAATEEKLEELVSCGKLIEEKINRKLDIISGGATTSLPRIIESNMPSGINHLRVGEGILLAKDLKDLWGYDMSGMYQDVFTLEAEVIEVKNKPTHPIGDIMFDAFGNKPTYIDNGIRKRALIALGKVDYANIEDLLIRNEGIKIIGASSDHTILDVEESIEDIKVGSIIKFDLSYSTMVYVTNSDNIKKEFVK